MKWKKKNQLMKDSKEDRFELFFKSNQKIVDTQKGLCYNKYNR